MMYSEDILAQEIESIIKRYDWGNFQILLIDNLDEYNKYKDKNIRSVSVTRYGKDSDKDDSVVFILTRIASAVSTILNNKSKEEIIKKKLDTLQGIIKLYLEPLIKHENRHIYQIRYIEDRYGRERTYEILEKVKQYYSHKSCPLEIDAFNHSVSTSDNKEGLDFIDSMLDIVLK